jgi:hypothetical protein
VDVRHELGHGWRQDPWRAPLWDVGQCCEAEGADGRYHCCCSGGAMFAALVGSVGVGVRGGREQESKRYKEVRKA